MGTYTFTCLACGTRRELPERHGGRRTTCDDECARVMMRERTRQWRAGKKAGAVCDRTCKHCNEPMPPEVHGHRVYCSKPCELRSRADRQAERRQAAPLDRRVHGPRGQVCTCPDCGTAFVAPPSRRWGSARPCSDCSAKRQRQRTRDYSKRHPEQVAARKKRWNKANPNYHADWVKANPEQARDLSRRGAQRRRHLKRTNGPSEIFVYDEIFERDRWVCGLCGNPVDRELKWPDDGCATLDHVLPIALGGTHTRDNVQLAHWACNRSKGARASA